MLAVMIVFNTWVDVFKVRHLWGTTLYNSQIT